MRRGRRRAEHLFVPRCQDREHTLVPQRLSRRARLQARTELPLDADYRRRRQLAHSPQLAPHEEDLLLGRRQGREDPSREGLYRPRGGRNGRLGHTRQDTLVGRRVERRGRAVPHQRPVAEHRGGAAAQGRAIPHIQGQLVLRPQGDTRHAGLYTPGNKPARRRGLQAYRQLPCPWHRRHDGHAHSTGGRGTRRVDVGGGRRADLAACLRRRGAHHSAQGRRLRVDDSFAGLAAQRKGALRLRHGGGLALGHAHGSACREHPRIGLGHRQYRGAAQHDAGLRRAARRRDTRRRPRAVRDGHRRRVVAERHAADRSGQLRRCRPEQGHAYDRTLGQGARIQVRIYSRHGGQPLSLADGRRVGRGVGGGAASVLRGSDARQERSHALLCRDAFPLGSDRVHASEPLSVGDRPGVHRLRSRRRRAAPQKPLGRHAASRRR